MRRGKLIVLDGLDGCGKTTQFEAIQKTLINRGVPFKAISFPVYGSPSAKLVEMYLSGAFSDAPSGVNAYTASTFYAADRAAQYLLDWSRDYQAGKLIIASRYTTSNAIHQMAKLPERKWDAYMAWLYDYEYEKIGLPRPDLVLFLTAPIDTIFQHVSNRPHENNKPEKDIHECDQAYLHACARAAGYAAKKDNWRIINCASDGDFFSVETIKQQLLREMEKIL